MFSYVGWFAGKQPEAVGTLICAKVISTIWDWRSHHRRFQKSLGTAFKVAFIFNINLNHFYSRKYYLYSNNIKIQSTWSIFICLHRQIIANRIYIKKTNQFQQLLNNEDQGSQWIKTLVEVFTNIIVCIVPTMCSWSTVKSEALWVSTLTRNSCDYKVVNVWCVQTAFHLEPFTVSHSKTLH